MRARRLAIAALLLLVATPPVAAAAPGTVDPSYGERGIGSLPGFNGDDLHMARDPEGGLVVAGFSSGHLRVARLTASGQRDVAYGEDGSRTIGWRPPKGARRSYPQFDPNGHVDALAMRPDGRLLVSGMAGADDAFVMQLTPDGRRDRSFHGDGLLFIALEGHFHHAVMDLRDDGTALVVITQNRGIRGTLQLGELDVYAFAPDGESVPSYGQGGLATVPFAATLSEADVELAPDGGLTVDVTAYFRERIRFRVELTPDGQPSPPVPVDAPAAATRPGFVARGINGEGRRSPASIVVERIGPDGAPDPAWDATPILLEQRGAAYPRQVLEDGAGRVFVLVDRYRFGPRSGRRHEAALVALRSA